MNRDRQLTWTGPAVSPAKNKPAGPALPTHS